MSKDKFTYNPKIETVLRGKVDVDDLTDQDYRLFLVKRRKANSAALFTNLYEMNKNVAYSMNIHNFLSLFSSNAQCTISRDVVCSFPLQILKKYLHRHKDVHIALSKKRGARYFLLMHADGFGVIFYMHLKRFRKSRGSKRASKTMGVVLLSEPATKDLIASLNETAYSPFVSRWV